MPSSSSKSPSPPPVGCYGIGASNTNGHGVSLTDLLAETELEDYEQALRTQLKILRVEHLKDVHESDLSAIGMSKPEQRRLMKAFQKYFPSSLAKKFRQKVLNRKQTQTTVAGSVSWSNAGASAATWSPSLRRCNSNEEKASATAAENSSVKFADDNQPGDGEQHIIAASNIILCRQLGQGEFGTVWQGVWTTSALSNRRYHHSAGPQMKIQVAVKQIMPQKMLSSSMDFLREAAIMHRIHHENIVRFFGVVLDTQTIMLVTELAPSRSLAECLREDRSTERFSIVQLCDFAQQICCGLAYLEANRFIHRDLAARNILVFSTHKVKISDFGLSRALGTGEEYYRGNFSVNLRLPIAWCAPECINYLKFTSASDVWAYGVTLWEMFTYGFQPWAGMNGQQIFDTVNIPKMGRLECPDACPQEYYNLMTTCWKHDPDKRPKFAEIASILPTIEPERVIAVKACEDGKLDHLQYALDMVITVLDKTPTQYPDGHYYWKGALKNGRTGLFLPANTVAYLESQRPGMPANNLVSTRQKTNGVHHSHPKSAGGLLRTAIDSIGGLTKRSGGKSGVDGNCPKDKNGKIRPVIGFPQNDFRQTGHLGLDGNCFGDVPQMAVLKNCTGPVPRRALSPSVISPPILMNLPQQRLESCSSDTAYLLTPDDDESREYRSSSRGTNSGADLDEVQPMSIVCGDSGGWLLDEVMEALDQGRSTNGGCTNMAARFSMEDVPTASISTDPQVSPGSILEDEEAEDGAMDNDRKHLWPTASTDRQHIVDGYRKVNKEMEIKQLSLSEAKILDEVDKLADRLSSKALDKERERLQEERRKLGLSDDWSENAERSPSPDGGMKRHLIRKLRRSSPNSCQSASGQRPTFTDSLAIKCGGGEMRVSPEAENAYKTLIEGKASSSSSILLPREERDDPQRPSVEEDRDDESGVDDETNPLRMLRNGGANVVRRFNRQGSGRRQQHLVEKPTPPIRKKFPDGAPASKASQNGKHTQDNFETSSLETNGDSKARTLDLFESSIEARAAKKGPPPPVPPRSSPKMDASRNGATLRYQKNDKAKPTAPAIPPKPKLANSSPPVKASTSRVAALEIENPLGMHTRAPTYDSRQRDGGCPSFTLDDVNKYDLLNFVLSGLPESRMAEERRKLISLDERQTSSPASYSLVGQNSRYQPERDHVASRKQILIDDDVVHV